MSDAQAGSKEKSFDQQDQAREILNQRLAQNLTTTNSTCFTKPNRVAKLSEFRLKKKKNNVDPLQLQQMKAAEQMNSLDRAERIPQDRYSLSGAVSIEQSPYKGLYEKVQSDMMGESSEQSAPYAFNKKLYQRHARKDEPKELHHFERMRPSTDLEV